MAKDFIPLSQRHQTIKKMIAHGDIANVRKIAESDGFGSLTAKQYMKDIDTQEKKDMNAAIVQDMKSLIKEMPINTPEHKKLSSLINEFQNKL